MQLEVGSRWARQSQDRKDDARLQSLWGQGRGLCRKEGERISEEVRQRIGGADAQAGIRLRSLITDRFRRGAAAETL